MGVASKTRDQEEAAASLGDSEMPGIKHAPESQIPALGNRPQDERKVAATVESEHGRDIFKHQPSRLYFAEEADDFGEQPALFSAQAALAAFAGVAGVAEILAGKAGGDAIDRRKVLRSASTDIRKSLGMGKSVGKQSPAYRIDFNLPRSLPAGALEAEIESADAGEEGAECFFDRFNRSI